MLNPGNAKLSTILSNIKRSWHAIIFVASLSGAFVLLAGVMFGIYQEMPLSGFLAAMSAFTYAGTFGLFFMVRRNSQSSDLEARQ